jgi:hypothetical protein
MTRLLLFTNPSIYKLTIACEDASTLLREAGFRKEECKLKNAKCKL